MNLEKLYKKETGHDATLRIRCSERYSAGYVRWLENKIYTLEKKLELYIVTTVPGTSTR